jgi:hypothetical protein
MRSLIPNLERPDATTEVAALVTARQTPASTADLAGFSIRRTLPGAEADGACPLGRRRRSLVHDAGRASERRDAIVGMRGMGSRNASVSGNSWIPEPTQGAVFRDTPRGYPIDRTPENRGSAVIPPEEPRALRQKTRTRTVS